MADITFYRSNINEFDASKNGGSYTEIAESGVINNLIPDVRAYTAEFGGERWFKFFIKANENLINIGVDIARFTASLTEEVYLSLGGDDEYESDLDKDNIRVYGGFKVVDFDGSTLTADRDVSNFVKSDDIVTFYNENQQRVTAWVVDSVDKEKITFKKKDNTNVKDLYASSSIFIKSLDKDKYQGFWIKQVIKPYTEVMEEDPDNFVINIWYEKK